MDHLGCYSLYQNDRKDNAMKLADYILAVVKEAHAGVNACDDASSLALNLPAKIETIAIEALVDEQMDVVGEARAANLLMNVALVRLTITADEDTG